jgi:transcriptional regulator with XRE-family HTH domain
MRKTLRSAEHGFFLDLLREARNQAELAQAALAKKLRRPQSFVATYENGERRITVLKFMIIARALQADSVELLQQLIEARDRPTRRGAARAVTHGHL